MKTILWSKSFTSIRGCYSLAWIPSQDRLQIGYATLVNTLPWFHKKGSEMEYDEYSHMLKMVCFVNFNSYHILSLCLASAGC